MGSPKPRRLRRKFAEMRRAFRSLLRGIAHARGGCFRPASRSSFVGLSRSKSVDAPMHPAGNALEPRVLVPEPTARGPLP